MKQQNDFLHHAKNAGWLLPLLLAGCSDEMHVFRPDDGASGLRLELQATIDQKSDTRADDSGFADGDRFGLFVVNYSGSEPGKLTLSDNQVNNVAVAYNADANSWQAATDIYWRDPVTPADVYGYYPFYNGMSNVEAYSFEVRADQSIAGADGEMGSYEASDFLWAKTPKAAPGKKVELSFGHIMAGVKVILEQGSGFEGDAWSKLEKTVTVDNTIRTSEIDLSTGKVTPVGAFDRNVKMCLEPGGAYRAVVVPQAIASGKSVIGITIEGVAYHLKRDVEMVYSSGQLHNFTVKIDRKDKGDFEVSLLSEEITPWENDQISHNFFEYEYTTVTVKEPGTLKAAISALDKDFVKVKNLKIIGPINTEDFNFMREEMSELAMLNMKEAKCVDVMWEKDEEVEPNHWETVTYHMDKAIPSNAFYGKSSLRRILFSDDIEYIGDNAFREIGLDVNSSIVLPKNLKYIGGSAFGWIGEAGELVLNDKLEYIGGYAFGASSFNCDLKLPPTLKYIGDHAFGYSGNNPYRITASGSFRLPDNLEYIGDEPFEGIEFDGVGELIVPRFMKEATPIFPGFKSGVIVSLHDDLRKIKHIAFYGRRFINKVNIPSKVTHIEASAFMEAVFNAGLTLPPSLRELGHRSFAGTRGLGNLEIPEGIEVIPECCFGGSDLSSVVLPNSVISIEAEAFACDIKSATIDKNCSFIGERAFSAPQLQTLICLNPEPPVLDGLDKGDDCHPFASCNLDHLVLQVPEESVELYRNTEGWNKIRFITAYHEMAVGVSEIQCLDKGIEYNTLLRSEGAWEVVSCPDWVKVTPSSGDMRRNEINIKVAATSVGDQREGTVVFKLKDKDYTTSVDVRQLAYQTGEDSEIILNKATASGDEIPVLFVGDGFTAMDIEDGSYMKMIDEAYSDFFSIEPYKSYKDYFTVSAAIAVSPDKGVSRNIMETTKFKICADESLSIDWNEVRSYASSIDPKYNSSSALIVVVPNYNSFIGMVDHSDGDADIAVCGYSQDTYPYDFRGVIQHFAGGIAFGKLAPEYVYHYEFMRGCSCPGCNAMGEYRDAVAKGWYGNVSLSGSVNTVPWQHYIFHPKYSDMVDVYEGALRHLRGIFRSENQSCMSTYINYYNTISRELIVRRIMSLSGNAFNLDDFIDKDSRDGCPQ
ncbi:MAG: leucine-rich repeat protein [Muribaculaceae bacterium]|nr:leucine-rich repeat protein [Muribaculaceae bacterium]